MINVSEFTEEKLNIERVSAFERQLRSLDANGRFTGFSCLIFIVCTERDQPITHRFITKCIYPETVKFFGVKAASVERGLRAVVKHCWNLKNHRALDNMAGYHLESIPTNSEFIDMLVSYIRYRLHELSNFHNSILDCLQ